MKKLFMVIGICALLLAVPHQVYATIYTFEPTPVDMDDLTHQYYYAWKINWSLPANEVITHAGLRIDDINDWTVETGDILYIHLINNINVGATLPMVPGGDVWRGYDNEGGGDNLSGKGILLTTYTDDDTWPNPPEDWTYMLTAGERHTLKNYSDDGTFWLGFDPDCHYYNNGIKFGIMTRVIPEPASISLLGLGLLSLVRFRRKK